MKERSIAMCIILSFITFGIYGIYWFVKINSESLELSGEEGRGAGMVILLSIITFGIYGLFWVYKLGERMDIIAAKNGRPQSSRSILYLILNLFGLSIVTFALVQDELNKAIANQNVYTN